MACRGRLPGRALPYTLRRPDRAINGKGPLSGANPLASIGRNARPRPTRPAAASTDSVGLGAFLATAAYALYYCLPVGFGLRASAWLSLVPLWLLLQGAASPPCTQAAGASCCWPL